MKKQMIAAAVAASMSAVALADVSISGTTKVNWTSTDVAVTGADNSITTEMDLNIVGKSGDTAVHLNLETKDDSSNAAAADALDVKNRYLTTNVGGVDVKVGTWYSGDSNLNDAAAQSERVSLTTDMGPMSVNYQHEANTDFF